MSPIARYHNILTNIDADVTRAERLLADALADVYEDERRYNDLEFSLLSRTHSPHGGSANRAHNYHGKHESSFNLPESVEGLYTRDDTGAAAWALNANLLPM